MIHYYTASIWPIYMIAQETVEGNFIVCCGQPFGCITTYKYYNLPNHEIPFYYNMMVNMGNCFLV